MYSTIQGMPQILLELLMQSNKKLSHKKAALEILFQLRAAFFSGETESPQCFQIKLDKFWLYGRLDCFFHVGLCDSVYAFLDGSSKKNRVHNFS